MFIKRVTDLDALANSAGYVEACTLVEKYMKVHTIAKRDLVQEEARKKFKTHRTNMSMRDINRMEEERERLREIQGEVDPDQFDITHIGWAIFSSIFSVCLGREPGDVWLSHRAKCRGHTKNLLTYLQEDKTLMTVVECDSVEGNGGSSSVQVASKMPKHFVVPVGEHGGQPLREFVAARPTKVDRLLSSNTLCTLYPQQYNSLRAACLSSKSTFGYSERNDGSDSDGGSESDGEKTKVPVPPLWPGPWLHRSAAQVPPPRIYPRWHRLHNKPGERSKSSSGISESDIFDASKSSSPDIQMESPASSSARKSKSASRKKTSTDALASVSRSVNSKSPSVARSSKSLSVQKSASKSPSVVKSLKKSTKKSASNSPSVSKSAKSLSTKSPSVKKSPLAKKVAKANSSPAVSSKSPSGKKATGAKQKKSVGTPASSSKSPNVKSGKKASVSKLPLAKKRSKPSSLVSGAAISDKSAERSTKRSKKDDGGSATSSKKSTPKLSLGKSKRT